ncbi:MMPL family transporter [Halorubraceae archaeon YAN]|nr:MMPL family transporter [Halorubraceae archaeon YAN]
MDLVDRYVQFIQQHSKATVLIVLLLTGVVGYGVTMTDGGFVIAGFDSDSPEADAAAYIDDNFDTGDETVTTLVVIRDQSGSDRAVTKDALLESLELQQAIRENETIAPTLSEGSPSFGLANIVGFVSLADADGPPPSDPTLEDQIQAIENQSESRIAEIVSDLTEDGDQDILGFFPSTFDPDTGAAEAQLLIVTHDRGEPGADELPSELVAAQVAINELASGGDSEFDRFAFGPGIVDELAGQATGESFALIGPIALVLVLVLLTIAYRDITDITLGLGGIALVLAWMGGFVGWLDIEFTQILIAVPFLLIGLSIDYALHVVMRYREEREKPGADVTRATVLGLTGVVVAIGATTITTTIGFFSNLTSDVGSISDFGLLSGLGIIAAFIIFGALLPAAKYEIELFLEARGIDRQKSAFGTGGLAAKLLGVGAAGAKRAPVVIVAIVLLVSLAGVYGAVNVETSIDQNDFLPEDRPAWMNSVPEPFRPGEYKIKEHAIYLDTVFGGANEQSTVDILIRGAVTDEATMAAVAAATETAREQDVTFIFANGDAAVETPIDVIASIAEENETVETQFAASDTTDDGVPDTDIGQLFDAAFAADEEAMAAVVARDGAGGYEALRLDITVRGDASGAAVLTQMRSVAAVADEPSQVAAIATGPLIIVELVQESVLETLVTTFALTLVLVGVFLSLLFGRRHGSYSLGAVTMLPVLFALSWILGTMYLIGIPYNSETAIITGIAIGIGVDFAIHITERFVQERPTAVDAIGALDATVKGTGGALLASAVTTVAGFGILALTLVPSLQRFGIVTGLTIAFAWVASVLVLPSLLLLWDRYLADQSIAH